MDVTQTQTKTGVVGATKRVAKRALGGLWAFTKAVFWSLAVFIFVTLLINAMVSWFFPLVEVTEAVEGGKAYYYVPEEVREEPPFAVPIPGTGAHTFGSILPAREDTVRKGWLYTTHGLTVGTKPPQGLPEDRHPRAAFLAAVTQRRLQASTAPVAVAGRYYHQTMEQAIKEGGGIQLCNPATQTDCPRDLVLFQDPDAKAFLEGRHTITASTPIAWLHEPRGVLPEVYAAVTSPAGLARFAGVVSHDAAVLKAFRAAGRLAFQAGGWATWVPRALWSASPSKSKMVSIVASPKRWLPGHALRHEVIQAFPFIEAFGKEYTDLPCKSGAHVPFRFSVVIENSRVQGYSTEKLVDSLLCGCVPFYWGSSASSLSKVGFDLNGILAWETLEDLRRLLKSKATAKVYEGLRDVIRRNYLVAKRHVSQGRILGESGLGDFVKWKRTGEIRVTGGAVGKA